VEGTFKIAKAAAKRGDWATAQKYYKQTMTEFSSRGQAPASDAAEFAGQAAFELAERKLQEFLKLKIKGNIDTLRGQENAMSKKAIALKNEYGKVVMYKRARWTLASLYRFGTIYEHFARSVAEGYRNAPVPAKVKRLGQDAMDIYMQQADQLLVQRVQPLEDQAKKLYEDCVNQAKNFGVSNQYTEAALQRLNAFDSMKYPLLKAPKLDTAIE